MNSTKTMASAAALLAMLLTTQVATAACSHKTKIKNNSGITLRFAELKSSYAQPFFKTQWNGSLVVASGDSGTISWSSDLDCTDASGVKNHWDVKLVRNNGNVHYCGNLIASENVKVNTPDLCFPN